MRAVAFRHRFDKGRPRLGDAAAENEKLRVAHACDVCQRGAQAPAASEKTRLAASSPLSAASTPLLLSAGRIARTKRSGRRFRPPPFQPGARCPWGRVLFQTAVFSAAALLRLVKTHAHVPDFACRVVRAAQNAAVLHDAAADAVPSVSMTKSENPRPAPSMSSASAASLASFSAFTEGRSACRVRPPYL
jgi:hypothetical protein